MGASRKLQGEIDRVLKKVQEGVEVFDSIWNKVYDTENANQKEKFEADLKKEIKKLQRYRDQIKTWIQSSEIKDKKVSASYEQALMDARKLIEREMERFKVCEKETKTKAFSKEGLGQQPKTDPKEKAKAETRDWLNNVVGDLESQIDNFEAEAEGLQVHLETSITRHKSHILKLELILRLLDNDELSPDQVNDVKDFLEDYVERNQDDFDDFANVDELYSSLPLEKVEALEDQFSLGPSSLVKATLSSTLLPSATQEQSEEIVSQDSTAEVNPRTPSKSGSIGSIPSAASPNVSSAIPTGPILAATTNIPARPLVAGPTDAALLSSPAARGVTENTSSELSSSLVNSFSLTKDDDSMSFPVRRPSPVTSEIGIGRGIGRGISNQQSSGTATNAASTSGNSSNGAPGSLPAMPDLSKRNMLSIDERIGNSALKQSLVSPLSNRILLQQVPKGNGMGSNDGNNAGEAALLGGRAFSPSLVTGVQWKPQSPFQNPNETSQLRGRPEIAPDQREKFLQRFQQVQQQGHSNLLNMPHLSSQKQFASQQQASLLQQLNSQNSSILPQVGLGLGIQGAGLTSISSLSQQLPSPILQQSSRHNILPSGTKDTDSEHPRVEEQQGNLADELNTVRPISPNLNKIINDDELKTLYMGVGTVTGSELLRETDLSPGQPLQPGQSITSLGVIGRPKVSELGAIGDNLSVPAGSSTGVHDHVYNLQMLDAAYSRLPQPKDSERAKSYIPRHPAVTPASYPQTQTPIVDNPALWERLGLDSTGSDALFFAFYYQPNSYQQYLAARELKRQSWRYQKKFNTWFQRHEEPKFANDNFERGTYVYFDFHMADNGSHGWCQRIKTDFTFEYEFLEDELVV